MNWPKYIENNINLFYQCAFKHCNTTTTAKDLVSDTVYSLLRFNPQNVKYPNSYIRKVTYGSFVKLLKKRYRQRDTEVSLDNVSEIMLQYSSNKDLMEELRERVLKENVFKFKWEIDLFERKLEGYTKKDLIKNKWFTESQVFMYNRRIRRYRNAKNIRKVAQ